MIRKQEQVIDSLDVWGRLAGPKSPVQWQDHRSAKECAKAWMESPGGVRVPDEIGAVLRGHPAFSEILTWEAEPECLISFDQFSGPANVDVLAVMHDQFGPFVLAVEAKADEEFGPLLGRVFTSALERRLTHGTSNGIARIEQLAAGILPAASGRVPKAHMIRYQLLTTVAAALAKAHAVQAKRAVVMVHEFLTPRTDAKKLERNRKDLRRFLARLGCENPEQVFQGTLVGPLVVPGSDRFPTPADLYIGKALRRIPADGQ